MGDLHADLAALRDEWRTEGIPCECGHTLDEHNGLGCYAVLTYTPKRVQCRCPLTDDRHDGQLAAQRIEALLAAHTPPSEPATEDEVWGNGCECWVTPEHMWTTHYGAVEPGSQVEFNPDCPEHGAQPAAVPDDLPVATGWAGSGPEGVERVEWGVRHRDGFVAQAADERSARAICQNWPNLNRHVVRRTVTEFAPVVGEWRSVEEGDDA